MRSRRNYRGKKKKQKQMQKDADITDDAIHPVVAADVASAEQAKHNAAENVRDHYGDDDDDDTPKELAAEEISQEGTKRSRASVFETFQPGKTCHDDKENNADTRSSYSMAQTGRKSLANPDMMKLLQMARQVSVARGTKKSASKSASRVNGRSAGNGSGKWSEDRILYQNVPMDWCIKTETRITSARSFDWCTHLSSLALSLGMDAFVRGEYPDTSAYSQPVGISSQLSVSTRHQMAQHITCELSAEFRKCLLYYRFPGNELPHYFQSALEKISGSDVDFSRVLGNESDARFMQQRVIDWIEAMCSIYDMLRNGQCPYFYVVTESFVVLFVAAGVCGQDNNVRATISHSTDHLRRRLRDECIHFTHVDDSLSNAHVKHKHGTLLFAGRSNVHALFDFLLNNCIAFDSGPLSIIHDVPVILSGTPFIHGIIKDLRIRTAEFVMANSSQRRYELVITGPLMPHTVHQLCDILRQTQHEFRMTFRQHLHLSTPLNVFHAIKALPNNPLTMASKQRITMSSQSSSSSLSNVTQGYFCWIHRGSAQDYLHHPERDEMQHMHMASIRYNHRDNSFEILRQI